MYRPDQPVLSAQTDLGRHILSQGYRVMNPGIANPQEAKRVCLDSLALHVYADPGRYCTLSPQCWFSRRRLIYFQSPLLQFCCMCDGVIEIIYIYLENI